ncbi:MAG: 4-hydroxy-tetrahydrodipicolinate reductase [Candidatus Eutrophobiaceae bacterium]
MAAMIRIGICGCAGRMGRAIAKLVLQRDDLALGAAIEASGHAWLGQDVGEMLGGGKLGVLVVDNLDESASHFDVLICFTLADAVPLVLEQCVALAKPLVIGTTGLDDAQDSALAAAAGSIPVMHSPNMSVGVNVCLRLLELAARALGDEVDVEIIEAHHRRKKDSPSGTALAMGQAVADALGRDLPECAIYGREGMHEERARTTIAFSTIRGGDIIGEHTVMFAGDGERVEIAHKAGSRDIFASGALRAAAWLAQQAPGLYDMRDVLGLR